MEKDTQTYQQGTFQFYTVWATYHSFVGFMIKVIEQSGRICLRQSLKTQRVRVKLFCALRANSDLYVTGGGEEEVVDLASQ